jgi:hypothetical protein
MDTFDGLFLEEASSEMGSSVASSETRIELDSSVDPASSTSIHHLLDESVRCQEELDRIFGPSIPYVLEIEDICFDEDDFFDKQEEHKRKENKKGKSGIDDLVEDHKNDEKINGDNNK